MVSQGSIGEAGEKGRKGKKGKREKEGGTFRVPGELLFRTREEAEAHLRAALDKWDDGDDGNDEGDEGDTRGRGVTRGVRWGLTRGVTGKGKRGVRRGVPGARMHPGNPPPRRGQGAGGLTGLTGLIGLTHHQVIPRRSAK